MELLPWIVILHPIYEVVWAEKPNTLNVETVRTHDEKGVFLREQRSSLKGFYKNRKVQKIPLVADRFVITLMELFASDDVSIKVDGHNKQCH